MLSRSKKAFIATGLLHVGVLTGIAGRWPESSSRSQRAWDLVSLLAVCSAGTAVLIYLDERRPRPTAETFRSGFDAGRISGKREVYADLKEATAVHPVARTGTEGPDGEERALPAYDRPRILKRSDD